MKPEVSVIIPVYNAKSYLKRCVDSILNQSFSNFECILIDDGSTDSSSLICDDYMNKDARVKVVHKKNSGVSSTRNYGIDISIGDWILFVDSDDWIEKNMIENMLAIGIKKNADIVICGVSVEDKKIIEVHGNDAFINSQDINIDYFYNPVWNKLFRKKIIWENKIKFDENAKLAEDACFFYKVFSNSKSVYGMKDVYYHYIIQEISTMKNLSIEKIKSGVDGCIQLEKYLIEKDRISDFTIVNELKMVIKDHFIFSLQKPEFDLWRKTFPNVKVLSLRVGYKKKILYIFIKLHFDFIILLMMKLFNHL